MWPFNKKVKEHKREEDFFDAIMDTVDETVKIEIKKLRYELMDLIFAVASAIGIKPKKVAENYHPDIIGDYATKLRDEADKLAEKHIIEQHKKLEKDLKKTGAKVVLTRGN